MKKSLLATLSAIVLLNACAARGARIERDPYFESFYEKARLIMTNEEIQIYKHLPDIQAKDEFIDEFWKKRDPFPETAAHNYQGNRNEWYSSRATPGASHTAL